MYNNFNQIIIGFEEKAKNLVSGKTALIFKLKGVQGIPEVTVTTLMTKLDNIADKMPVIEKRKFIDRFSSIIPNDATKYIYDDQFNEVLVEFLGWGWLKAKYPSYIPFFNHPKSPDLLINENTDVVAAMECKHIRSSVEDRCYFANIQGTAVSAKDDLTPFSNKLNCTLSNAEAQLKGSEAFHKFIFLDFSFDRQFFVPEEKKRIICLIKQREAELVKRGILLFSFEQFNVDNPITGA